MNAVIFGWKRDILIDELKDCEDISKFLTKNKFSIYTGGGGGFMEAGNKGCYNENKDKSYGISVKSIYGKEKQKIAYYNKDNLTIADNFRERKNLLFKNMDLYIFFPGGVGTLDEFMTLINLFKVGELEPKPVILYGYKYWTSLIGWFDFNKMSFPHKYINKIINSYSEFKNIYDNIYKSNQIIEKTSSDDEINNYQKLSNKKNVFQISNLDNIINDLFEELINENVNNNDDEYSVDVIEIILEEVDDSSYSFSNNDISVDGDYYSEISLTSSEYSDDSDDS